MLDFEGNIAEATGANIFFKTKDGQLHTCLLYTSDAADE